MLFFQSVDDFSESYVSDKIITTKDNKMKFAKSLLLVIYCSLITIHCSAQLHGQARIDSLLKELPKQKEDTNKVNLLNNLSLDYSSIDPDEGIKYGKQGVALAHKINWKKGLEAVNSTLGSNYQTKTDYSEALKYHFKALKMAEEMGDKTGVARNSSNIGIVYCRQSKYSTALEYFFSALRMAEDLGDRKGIAATSGNIGVVYKTQGDYPKALEYYFKSLKMNEELGRKSGIATNNGNIGRVYQDQGDYPKALEYFFKSLEVYEELGDKKHIATVTGNIGVVYKIQSDYPKALEFFLKALKMNEELGNRRGIATNTGNIGMVYQEQRDYTQAIDYYQSSLKLNEELGQRYFMAIDLSNIGSAYLAIVEDIDLNGGRATVVSSLSENKYRPAVSIPTGRTALITAAIDYMERGLEICQKIETLDILQDCYEGLAKAYKLKGDYKKSLEASDNYHAIKDSVFSQENKEEILKMGMKNDYERQRLTDSLKVAEKQKIAAINLKKQKSYTYMGMAGILLLAGFSFFIVKERGKSETARKQSDELLLNILPEEVASELKTTGTTTAKHYDNVTVLFTDFVNFTQASESMGAQNLIDELHTCFKKFDEISDKYGIEKIKTIGDAYLAVAGLPTADPNHAENIMKAAREITTFMEDRLSKMGTERTFAVRIGIHSGSVVAGIVGVKKFAYDIWGDTVNTAARMEQNSEAGKINISQTTYELVKDKFDCEYRGEVDAKGKGMMKMYYVG